MYSKINIISLIRFRVYFLAILFLSTGFSTFSQESVKDSIKVKKQVIDHSPRKATIYSAVLPGLGQIYNRKYWKVPLVYGGFAAFGYFIIYENEVYTTYRQAYSDIIDTNPYTNSFLYLKVNPSQLRPENRVNYTESLRRAKDGVRRNRDLLVIGTAVFYALNIIDASVDANFFNFDISDDLTFNWVPGPLMCLDRKMIGINCIFTF